MKGGDEMTLSKTIQAIASKTEQDATKVGKKVRAHIRRNRDELAKSWPALKDHEKGNGYGDIPLPVHRALVKRFTK
jgi:hypothetical protein